MTATSAAIPVDTVFSIEASSFAARLKVGTTSRYLDAEWRYYPFM